MAQAHPNHRTEDIESDEVRHWQRNLIQGALRAMTFFGLFMLVGAVYSGYVRGHYWAIPVYLIIYLIVVAISLWSHAPYRLQVFIMLLLLYVLAVVVFVTRGLGDSSRIYLLTMLFVAGIFLSWRECLYTLLVVLGTMAVFAWLFTAGYIKNYEDVVSVDGLAWATMTFELLGMGIFIIISLNYLVPQIRNSLTRSRKLTQELERIQADLESRVAERTRSAELARQEAEQSRQVLEQQLAFVRAQTQLNNILRSTQDIRTLADNALGYLCHYLNAPVGGLYLLQDGAFERIGKFALPADFSQGESFKPGEGLVGQAAMERHPVVVRDIPPGGLEISSGLGRASPALVLAVPLFFGAETVGVLELGLLNDDTLSEKLTFLEQAAESIAVAFNVIRNRMRIENLLAETQRQAEQLRSQEEELRITNEELRMQAEHALGRDS